MPGVSRGGRKDRRSKLQEGLSQGAWGSGYLRGTGAGRGSCAWSMGWGGGGLGVARSAGPPACGWVASVDLGVSSLRAVRSLSLSSCSRLHSNHLFCDCHLAWLSQWLRQRPSIGLFTQCAGPASLRGLNVAEVQKSEFSCSGGYGPLLGSQRPLASCLLMATTTSSNPGPAIPSCLPPLPAPLP